MNDKPKQIVLVVAGAVVFIGVIVAVVALSHESDSRTYSRLHAFAASLPQYAGSSLTSAVETSGTCSDVSTKTVLPAIISRTYNASVDDLTAQSNFTTATSSFTWQGTSEYAFAIVPYKNKTYEITFPSDETSLAVMVTACD